MSELAGTKHIPGQEAAGNHGFRYKSASSAGQSEAKREKESIYTH